MDYNHFTVKDFVRDPYFQKWILSDDAKVASFWKTWLEQHPHKAEEVAKARETIRLLGFQRSYQTNEDFLEVWESVEQKIGDEVTVSVPRRAFLKPLLRAAAVLIGLLITTALLLTLWENNATVTYATQFGETRSVSLPDGSEVTINANSSIKFSENWDYNSTREVWLKGEAFFEVKKVFVGTSNQTDSSLPVKFIVHTGSLDVEVIGTQFNVNNRRQETKVVLKSGKVKLNVKDGENIEEVFMQPGDMVAFNKVSKAITKKVVNPGIHSSWVDHKLIFDEVLLKDIAQTMEDMYGINVVFKDPKLAEEQFTGVLPSNDINALLEAFTKVYGIRVTNDKNSITFHPQIESE